MSFGSGGTLTSEFNKLSLGLEKIEQQFLWVIRSPNKAANSSYFDSHSKTNPFTCLPSRILEQIKYRGFVIPS